MESDPRICNLALGTATLGLERLSWQKIISVILGGYPIGYTGAMGLMEIHPSNPFPTIADIGYSKKIVSSIVYPFRL